MLTGIVQEVINNGVGKGSGLKIDNLKYGVFDPVKSGLDVIAVGDEVTFNWSQKGQYKNIQGAITKTGNTGTPAPTASGPSSGWKVSGGNKGGGRPFPIPALDGQRSIVRQNALGHSTSLITSLVSDGRYESYDAETIAEHIVGVARIFEEYSCGDDAEKAANEAIAKMQATGSDS